MLDYIGQHYWDVLIVFNYTIATTAVLTLILKNNNPTKTLSYVIILIFFPFLGLLVYYLFGQEYRKTKIFRRKQVLNQSTIQKSHEALKLHGEAIRKVDDYLGTKTKLVQLLQSNKNSPLTLHNAVTLLKNGNPTFEALLKDLKAAKHHIHLEYYIIKDGVIGTQLLNILCEKAKAGLSVKLIYDDVGSKLSSAIKQKLTASGVAHYPFMPVFFSKFTGKMNYRNHRKIAVIDGTIAYVGGVNISDEYLNVPSDTLFWRDTHLRIEGEAVTSLQVEFFMTWDFVSAAKTNVAPSYFPKVTCKDNIAIQIASSGPDTNAAHIMEALFLAITTAEDYVYITTPYFVPNAQIITALRVAAKSGVDVRLIIPKASDSWVVKHATNSYLEHLMLEGIKVYRYTKGFVHAKTMVVDDIFSTVGTSNMDYRSFNINFEVNAFIYDIETSKTLKAHFLEDLKSCERIDAKQWQQRSKFERWKESYCRLWSPLI